MRRWRAEELGVEVGTEVEVELGLEIQVAELAEAAFSVAWEAGQTTGLGIRSTEDPRTSQIARPSVGSPAAGTLLPSPPVPVLSPTGQPW